MYQSVVDHPAGNFALLPQRERLVGAAAGEQRRQDLVNLGKELFTGGSLVLLLLALLVGALLGYEYRGLGGRHHGHARSGAALHHA